MFNASFPKTLVSLQLFRDTMDVSRIFLHQVGEEWIPERIFTMQLHNNKVANPLYQMQRVWIAVPAVDRGSSDLFKMMNIFFNNPKLNSLIIDGQLEDVYVPHYASSWNNALDNKYYQVTQQGVNFDSNLFNDMTNKQINDNKLIMSTVIFPQTATPAVTYTGDALRSIAADFKMPVRSTLLVIASVQASPLVCMPLVTLVAMCCVAVLRSATNVQRILLVLCMTLAVGIPVRSICTIKVMVR